MALLRKGETEAGQEGPRDNCLEVPHPCVSFFSHVVEVRQSPHSPRQELLRSLWADLAWPLQSRPGVSQDNKY